RAGAVGEDLAQLRGPPSSLAVRLLGGHTGGRADRGVEHGEDEGDDDRADCPHDQGGHACSPRPRVARKVSSSCRCSSNISFSSSGSAWSYPSRWRIPWVVSSSISSTGACPAETAWAS